MTGHTQPKPITKMIMNNLINQKAVGWMVVSVTALALGVLSGVAANAANKVETWHFDSSASPILPDLVTLPPASCQAMVQPGNFASGWLETNPVFGSAHGVWDLGRLGTITCSGLGGLVGGAGQERACKVKVTQYNDGAIYSVLTSVSIPGATLVGSSVTSGGSGALGDWVTQETRWRLPSAVAADAVQITSAYDGSLVDQVSVETAAVVALPPPQLSIRRVGAENNQVEVSWPAEYSGMVLESNADAGNPAGWSTVEVAVETNAGVSSVTVAATGTAQFYRLKQP